MAPKLSAHWFAVVILALIALLTAIVIYSAFHPAVARAQDGKQPAKPPTEAQQKAAKLAQRLEVVYGLVEKVIGLKVAPGEPMPNGAVIIITPRRVHFSRTFHLYRLPGVKDGASSYTYLLRTGESVVWAIACLDYWQVSRSSINAQGLMSFDLRRTVGVREIDTLLEQFNPAEEDTATTIGVLLLGGIPIAEPSPASVPKSISFVRPSSLGAAGFLLLINFA